MSTVTRLKAWIADNRITPLGWVLLIIAPAAFVTSGVGPSSLQTPAFILGMLIVLFMLAGSLSGGTMGRTTKGFQERRSEFGPKPRDPGDGEFAASDEALWQRERERREGRV